ncbi:MAG: protein disulfide oxidoreductase [Sedimenticolaceae bacterium]|jgi:thiol-disulfide isomerase/thioredoxin
MSDQSKSISQNSGGKPRPRWWRWLRDIALLLLFFAAVQWWQARDLSKGPAPALVGHLSNGTPYQLDPAEGPTLVHFWASWCPICRLEQDSIASIAGDSPVITVATTSGSPQEVEAYLAGEGLRMPVLMDEDGEIARSWGVSGVPATFVVDTGGDISHAGMGYSSELGLRLRLWLAEGG